MQNQFSIAEAKNKLPSIIHDVEHGHPVTLTRHGTPVAMLMSFEDFQAIKRDKPDFWSALVQFRQESQLNDGTFSENDFNNLRDKSTGRTVEL